VLAANIATATSTTSMQSRSELITRSGLFACYRFW